MQCGALYIAILFRLSSAFLITYGHHKRTLSEDNKVHVYEVCPFDTFEPSCQPGYKLLITEARYGRMRFGRCIDSPPVGCYVNALQAVSELCSDKTTCSVAVPISQLHADSPCAHDQTQYLEVAYNCIPEETTTHASTTPEISPIHMTEVCMFEQIDITCDNGEAIVITEARIGRMTVGRCLQADYYIGCYGDVSAQVGDECSGQSQCTLDPTLYFRLSPCRKDLVAYLDVRHECVSH